MDCDLLALLLARVHTQEAKSRAKIAEAGSTMNCIIYQAKIVLQTWSTAQSSLMGIRAQPNPRFAAPTTKVNTLHETKRKKSRRAKNMQRSVFASVDVFFEVVSNRKVNSSAESKQKKKTPRNAYSPNHCREAFKPFPDSAVRESLGDDKLVHLLVDHDIALLLRRLGLLSSRGSSVSFHLVRSLSLGFTFTFLLLFVFVFAGAALGFDVFTAGI